MYTRLSARRLAVLHGQYPRPHPHPDGSPVVWIRGRSVFLNEEGEAETAEHSSGSDDLAIFWCWCGRAGFIARSKIEEILDPACTMRPWVKEQRNRT